jgi:exosortase B
MSQSSASLPVAPSAEVSWPIRQFVILGLGLLVLFIPTYFSLAGTAWLKDDNGHAPIIIALSFWLLWNDRVQLFSGEAKPAMISGWVVLVLGLAMYVLGRSQAIDTMEALSHVFLLMACMLMLRGWALIRMAWFALFFMLFMVPLPGVLVQAITMPLKVVVSIVAEAVLHAANYPIGRSGVTLTVGPYQLMVADACSGLNSLFTLESLGLFYMKIMNYQSRARNTLLALAIIPISFVSNVIRVMVLVLVTYHLGDEAGQGFLHGFAGMLLFAVALTLTYFTDRLLASRFDESQGQKRI